MLEVKDGNYIHLTRGDTAYLAVEIKNEVLDEEYVLDANDELTMTVKKHIEDETYCFQKTLKGKNIFKIEPEDTKDLEYGSYYYDVQVTTKNGEVYTIVTPSKFKIMKEVTY